MGGGVVEYDGGGLHTALATHRYADKACEIAGFGGSSTDALCSWAWKLMRCAAYAFSS